LHLVSSYNVVSSDKTGVCIIANSAKSQKIIIDKNMITPSIYFNFDENSNYRFQVKSDNLNKNFYKLIQMIYPYIVNLIVIHKIEYLEINKKLNLQF
jgi:hypothetical protein